jgi:chromosome segregation and condensation protein ScpB
VRLVQDGQKYCFSVPDKLTPEPSQPRPKIGLSRQAMEILALIITKGALTRKEILQLRGVTSDKALVSLIERNLLTTRRDYLKKMLVYDLSEELLERWGFTSREELLQEIESRRRGL